MGGTDSAYMLSTELPAWQANPSDVVFIWVGKNETPNSAATRAAVFGRVSSVVTALFAGGAGLVVICGFGADGTASTSGKSLGVDTLNNLFRNAARANDRIVFVETQDLVLDIANATGSVLPFLGTAGAYQSMNHDGTHWSNYAVRTKLAPRIEPILRRIAGVRRPRCGGARPGTFAPSSTPDINLLGDAALTMTAGAGWYKAGGSGADCTLSTVTKADGFTAARLTLSGTTTGASAYLIFGINIGGTLVNNGDSTRLYEGEGLIDVTGVTGLTAMQIQTFAQSTPQANTPLNFITSDSARYPDGYTDTDIFLYNTFGVTHGGNNPNLWFLFNFANAQTLSGTIDVRRPAWQRVA